MKYLNDCNNSVKEADLCLIDVFFSFKGQIQPLFLRHEGYLGAIGAFLKGAEKDGKFLLLCFLFLTNTTDYI